MSAREAGAASSAAHEAPDASAVAFEGRTDAVSAGIAHDEADTALSELRGRRAAAMGRAARARRATATASRDAFGESDEELGADALSRPAGAASRATSRRLRRARGGDGSPGTGGGGHAGPRPAPAQGVPPAPEGVPPVATREEAAITATGATGTPGDARPPRSAAPVREAPRRHGARSRLAALDGREGAGPGRARPRRTGPPRRGWRREAAPPREAMPGTTRAAETARAADKAAYAAGAPATVPIAGILAGAVVAVLAAAMISQAVGSLFGFWDNEASRRASVEGLPPYVTYSMVLAALECQDEYGHPAGCTLAQVIVESGVGDHLSGLATRDNNLFGIKWAPSFASCPEVAGKESWQTREEYGGASVTVVDAFTRFRSYEDCIRFRSRVLLQAGRYSGNEKIRRAIEGRDSDLMAEGLKDAGYATSSSYVDSLKAAMDAYGLRRFDSMSADDLRRAGPAGAASGKGATIVAAAQTQLGTPYVWGGSTPNKALDCSGLTQWCYAQAGIRIPHQSDAQLRAGTMVPLSQAEPGDILWRPGHVAIYIGGDSYIHAPQPGDHVRVGTGISRFTCAVRIQ